MLEQNPVMPNDECVYFDNSFGFTPRFSYGKCSWIFCTAKRFDRAHVAFRLPDYADERAKIEQCGVKSCGIGFWEKTFRMLPKCFSARFGVD